MRIQNKETLKTKPVLTAYNLEDGEVFAFFDENSLYMIVDDSQGCVDIETGEFYSLTNYDWNYRPVKRINVKVVIE